MRFTNRTSFEAGYEQAAFKDDSDGLVFVVKATYQIPDVPNGQVVLSPNQQPLVSDDQFSDFLPAECADLVYESDFSSFKPKCDIVLQACAHAPNNEPVKELDVMVKVGDWQKKLSIVGDRHWKKGTLGRWILSEPEPFIQMPIDYQHTFGGYQEIESYREHFEMNPCGRGYVYDKLLSDPKEVLVPNVYNSAEVRQYKRFGDVSTPASFAPISSLISPRLELAGTFDANYIVERFPALPSDYQDEFLQIAPGDQQVEYLVGGELIELFHLSPQSYLAFSVPSSTPVIWLCRSGEKTLHPLLPNLDTLYIEPDKKQFQVIWRLRVPFNKNVHEIEEVIVGKKSKAWTIARQKNKRYYPSLSDIPKKRHRL